MRGTHARVADTNTQGHVVTKTKESQLRVPNAKKHPNPQGKEKRKCTQTKLRILCDLHQPRNPREPEQHSKPTEGVSLRRLRPVLDVNRDRIQESVCPTIRLTTRSRGARSLDMKMDNKVARHARRTNLRKERWTLTQVSWWPGQQPVSIYVHTAVLSLPAHLSLPCIFNFYHSLKSQSLTTVKQQLTTT